MKLQLKRSNVIESGAAKEPIASQLEYGELAVNYNKDDPAIFLKDSNNNVIRISGIGNIADDGQVELPASNTPPANPLPGNLWYNSEDGRLYIYYKDPDTEQWVDASPDAYNPSGFPDLNDPNKQPGTIDDRYVNITGDDMTGNLTLGTDKITLNTDGSASFAGGVGFGGQPLTGSMDAEGARITENGVIQLRRDGNNVECISVFGNGNSSSEKNVAIFNDGSATFGVFTDSADLSASQGTGKTDIYNAGSSAEVRISKNAANTALGTYVRTNIFDATGKAQALVIGNENNINLATGAVNADGAHTVEINADGSASFAKYVDSGHTTGEGLMRIRQDSDTSAFAIYKTDSYDYKVRILGDGSATFASYVKSEATSGTFSALNPGYIVVQQPSGSSNDILFRGRTSAGNEVAEIWADGRATFAGDVLIGDYDVSNSNKAGIEQKKYGRISVQRSLAEKDSSVFQAWAGTGKNVEIFANGSATFAGVVDSSSYNTAGGNPSYQLVPTGLFQVTGTTGEAAIRVFPQGAGNQNPSATINTDGDALFAGDVVSTSSSNSRSFIDGEGIYQSDVLGNNAITLLNDGNGEFTGTITTQGGAGGPYVAIGQTITFNTGADDDANYTITTETYEEQEELTPYVPAVEEVVGPLGNVLVAGVPAVEATYQTVTKTREIRTYTGPTLDVKDKLQNLIARLDSLEADEVTDDATSTLLLTTVNNLNADMAKTKAALTAIRVAANAAGTLEQLKADIATATADI